MAFFVLLGVLRGFPAAAYRRTPHRNPLCGLDQEKNAHFCIGNLTQVLNSTFTGIKPFQKGETFEKCSILFKAKEGKNFNHRHTFCISRIKI